MDESNSSRRSNNLNGLDEDHGEGPSNRIRIFEADSGKESYRDESFQSIIETTAISTKSKHPHIESSNTIQKSEETIINPLFSKVL